MLKLNSAMQRISLSQMDIGNIHDLLRYIRSNADSLPADSVVTAHIKCSIIDKTGRISNILNTGVLEQEVK